MTKEILDLSHGKMKQIWVVVQSLPSGNLLQFANLKITIEIVDVPINSMVIFHSYVSLPEGNH